MTDEQAQPIYRDVSNVTLSHGAQLRWSDPLIEFDECPFCKRRTAKPYVLVQGKWRKSFPYPCDCYEARKRRGELEKPATSTNYEPKFQLLGKSAEDWISHMEKTQRGIYFWGSTGTGKTTMVKEICEHENGEFTTLSEIQAETYDMSDREKIFAFLRSSSLLVFDDLGMEAMSEAKLALLYIVINSRWETNKKTVITSNLGIPRLLEDYAKIDYFKAHSIGSRLAAMVESIEVTGKDWRLEK